MLRNNKLLYILTLIFCSPFVYAQESLSEKGFIGITSLLLGKSYSINEALIRIAIFAILFGLFFKGLQNAFPRTPSMSKIIGTLMALIAVRLMPYPWMASMGKVLVVAAVIIIPFMVINIIFKEWSLLKIGFLILAYLGVYFMMSGYNFFGFGFFNKFVSDMGYYYNVYKFQFITVISALIAYLSLRYLRKGHIR